MLPLSTVRRFAAGLCAALALTSPARAVILDATGDPTANTAAPTGTLADSGWQYEGLWGSFLGTAIASQYFITASHIGGSIGDPFRFNGIDYITDAVFDDPASDLRIWHVTLPLPTFAPLYTKTNEVGKALVVIGRGTQRGADVVDDLGSLHGYLWGSVDGVQRWGTNVVTESVNGGTGLGPLLGAQFNHIGGTEATLSVYDSGGAVFIQDGTVWKLAGINYGVTGPYYTSPTDNVGFNAALFDQSTFYTRSLAGVYTPASGPGEFYATRISSNRAFIDSIVVPEPSSLLLGCAGMLTLLARRRRSR